MTVLLLIASKRGYLSESFPQVNTPSNSESNSRRLQVLCRKDEKSNSIQLATLGSSPEHFVEFILEANDRRLEKTQSLSESFEYLRVDNNHTIFLDKRSLRIVWNAIWQVRPGSSPDSFFHWIRIHHHNRWIDKNSLLVKALGEILNRKRSWQVNGRWNVVWRRPKVERSDGFIHGCESDFLHWRRWLLTLRRRGCRCVGGGGVGCIRGLFVVKHHTQTFFVTTPQQPSRRCFFQARHRVNETPALILCVKFHSQRCEFVR